ncbi:glutamate receptor ionotropic, kainate 2-like [Agrilus planipennis]|uniref:Glutamate receptor ionotropic, kainate 2-like n=1 Tax=Agrilus planipennis TaxID=224129 RepID=A0A1W4WXN9_AGRPL|nr:glutamate receptor ionotropic, kainate 2-like [Agrilus planipennis]
MFPRVSFYCIFLFVFFIESKCQEDEEEDPNQNIVRIGALFEVDNEEKQLALNLSVQFVLTQGLLPNYQLETLFEVTKPDHPFAALSSACNLLKGGALGIIGPPSEENANAVQSLCDFKEIALIQTRWDAEQQRDLTSLNLYPYPPVLARVFVDIVEAWEWKSFTILYENKEGLFRISELLRMYNSSGHTIVVRQLDNDNSGDYRSTLKEVLKSGQTHFIIDCSIDNLNEVLIQAQQVGLISSRFNFIITNLDLHTIDLEPFKYAEANITGVRLLNPENSLVKVISTAIHNHNSQENSEPPPGWTVQLDVALIIDAVGMFSAALNQIVGMENVKFKAFDCETEDNSMFGLNIITYMKTLTFEGLSGIIKFDNKGFRSDFSLDVVELNQDGLIKIGDWNSTEGLKISRVYPEAIPTNELSLRNRTFVVITALTAPYAMMKKSEPKLTGNDQYEGFGIDLIKELALMEGFSYEFKIREDKANGQKQPNGEWTGMIGEVLSKSADLAIVDLTITAERVEAVDFTSPFMTLGVSILYRKPTKAPPSFFSFASPFGNDVWITLSGAYLCVSLALFITGRLSPSEWNNPFPCIEEPKYLLNQFSLRNSFWFTIGSLMQQGSEIAPIAISTRMVAGVWWFFTLIMVSSYTANLAAFLTADTPLTEFSSVKELAEKAERSGIKYGAKAGGATAKFFETSENPYYKKIWEYMASHPEDMPKENIDGVERAEREKYAFFMESTSIEYEIQRHCNLSQVGGKLDEKGYGIAMRKNSSYRHILSTAVLKLQESGKITELKRKWWEERGAQCTGEEASQEAPPLDLVNVSGIFWVTVAGTVLAFVFVCIEMVLYVFRVSLRYKVSFLHELRQEIKHCFAFDSSTKPVRQKLMPTPEEESEKCPENGDNKINSEYGFKPEIMRE